MHLPWLFLILAGLFEVGWPIGFQVSQNPEYRYLGIIFAIFCMLTSGALLWLAQKEIPMGTAYAVWTGIGAAGTFIVGITYFGDPASPLRILAVSLIIAGVILLKYA